MARRRGFCWTTKKGVIMDIRNFKKDAPETPKGDGMYNIHGTISSSSVMKNGKPGNMVVLSATQTTETAQPRPHLVTDTYGKGDEKKQTHAQWMSADQVAKLREASAQTFALHDKDGKETGREFVAVKAHLVTRENGKGLVPNTKMPMTANELTGNLKSEDDVKKFFSEQNRWSRMAESSERVQAKERGISMKDAAQRQGLDSTFDVTAKEQTYQKNQAEKVAQKDTQPKGRDLPEVPEAPSKEAESGMELG